MMAWEKQKFKLTVRLSMVPTVFTGVLKPTDTQAS